jgi:anti-sigma B factor antagonist
MQEDVHDPDGIVDRYDPPFAVRVVDQGSRSGPAVASITGEVDLATAPEMQRVLLQLLNDGNARLIVDMAAVGFIDCFGLGVLIAMANAAHVFGGGIALRSPSRQVCRVRDWLELGEVLPSEDDIHRTLRESHS